MPLTGKESENYYLSRIVELLGGGAELPTRGKENTTYYLERIVDLLQAGAIGSLPVAAGDDVTRLEVQISGTAATVENYAADFRLVWCSGTYTGLIDSEWIGFEQVEIQCEATKGNIP